MTDTPRPTGDDDRPATYRELFASREVLALFISYTVSRASGMLARVAVTFLVWDATGSPLLAGGAFAVTYLPYLGPAQLLAALADRMPYRTVMIASDLIRMVLIGIVAIPGMPLPLMLAMIFGAALVEPAYQSSRSALMPKLLSGELLTLALATYATVSQAAVLSGYLLGGVIAAADPHIALAVNSSCYAVSAVLLTTLVRPRPASPPPEDGRKNLLQETGQGFALVFGHRVLRMIALGVFSTMLFLIVPEGAAAAWAAHLDGGAALQGAIMAAAPVAALISMLGFTRFVRPKLRQRMTRPLLLTAPLVLCVAFFDPPAAAVVATAVAANLGMAVLPHLNAVFVRTVPDGYRARAASVMQTGLALVQGFAVLAVGATAELGLSVPRSVGLWGAFGVLLIGTLLVFWPSDKAFDQAVEEEKTDSKHETAPEKAGERRRL